MITRTATPESCVGSVSSSGSVAFSVVTDRGAQPSRIRWQRRVNLGEPCHRCICRLNIFVSVLTPSVRPSWCGWVNAAMAVWMSRSSPRVKACRWHRHRGVFGAALAPVIAVGVGERRPILRRPLQPGLRDARLAFDRIEG